MSGLALVCARLGATVTGSDRSDSSYMERLRAAGLEPAVGHDAANLPEGAEVVVSTAIGDDNPELAAGPRARGRADPPRRAAGRALRREAADRGRRHPRQDDDDGDDRLGAAGDRRRPGLLRRRRGAGGRRGRRRRQRRLGRGRVGGRRGRREGRQLPAAAARGRRRHQRRDGPPRPLGLARRAARRLRRLPRARPPARRCRPTARSTSCRRAATRGSLGFDATRPGRAELELAVPGRHNRPTPAPRWPRSSSPGLDVEAAAAALPSFPGVRRRLELQGRPRRRPHIRRLRPPPDRGPRRAQRPARARTARLLAVFQPHLYSRTKALRRRSSARRWRSPTRSRCSTSTRPARSRSASWPGSAASMSPAPPPIAPAAGRSGGCPTRRRAERALADRLDRTASSSTAARCW